MAVVLLAFAAISVCGFLGTNVYAAHEISSTALLFTYYDVRPSAEGGLGLSDNYFAVTNPDPNNWTQAHIRVRTGDKSVELLDLDVMLSPNDVFTFDISDDGEGVVFSSLDKHTIANTKMLAPFLIDIDGDGVTDGVIFSTNHASPFFSPNLTSLIELCQAPITQADAAALTKKGYVEVIMEGKVAHLPTCKNSCNAGVDGLACTADDVLITEHTLYELTTNVKDGTTGLCNANVLSASLGLEGRVYYASVDPSGLSVPKLSHLQAETMDNALPALPATIDAAGRGLILHQNTYDLERFSNRCLDVLNDGSENCFAYTAATAIGGDLDSSLAQGGADDLNFCFYTDKLTVGGVLTGVFNKFGAAATFGPTIADLDFARDGTLLTTATNLDVFSANSAGEWSASNGLSTSGVFTAKNFIHSHYLFSPAPAAFDLTTAFGFIFPVQHFIGEQTKVGSFTFYDLDESTITPTGGGFISPGLPGPGAPVTQEASLQTLSNAPFAEGWLRIGAVTATNVTNNCTPQGVAEPVADIGDCLVRTAAVPYTPGYTSTVFITGPLSLSSSLNNYLNY